MSDRRTSVVMLGFEAMDPGLTEQMALEGQLPAFRLPACWIRSQSVVFGGRGKRLVASPAKGQSIP
jgi:hypothetical protein